MAKRHATYEELSQLIKENSNFFKPANTCGAHQAILVPSPDGQRIIVIGISSNGEPTKRVIIKPGETLGYDCGVIWRVPDPRKIKDPLRRALLEMKISSKILYEVDTFDGVGDQLHAQGVGDGELENKIYSGKEVMYFDKEVLIVVDYFQTECWRNQHARIWKIFVKKTADRKSASEVIKNFRIPMNIYYGGWWKRISTAKIVDYTAEDLAERFAKS